MDTIINWLITIESIAHNFYLDSSDYFKNDPDLSKLLLSMATDETYHLHVLQNANKYISENHIEFISDIKLDDEIKNRIYHPFEINLQKLKAGTLEIDDIYNCLLTTEFSEWNDIFVYITNSLSKQNKEFQIASAKIQNHLSKLEYYFNSNTVLKKYYNEIIKIPKIWDNKILLIDDDEPIINLLNTIFKRYFHTVEIAKNGNEGFNKILNNYYDVIISDIDMPIMNGIDMFKKISQNPLFDKETIMFISGNHDNQKFFDDNNLKYFEKPFNIKELIDQVDRIINRNIADNLQ